MQIASLTTPNYLYPFNVPKSIKYLKFVIINNISKAMKSIIRIIITIISLSFASMSANELSVLSQKENKTILTNNNQSQPKIPSTIFIECYHSIGHIRFTLPSNTEYLYIIIGDEATPVWTGFVTRTTPETDIPVLSGEYAIICRTDGNQIFSGMLKF